MKTLQTLEYAATLLTPFHLALGDKFDDAAHRTSSALGAVKFDETLGKVKFALNGKVTAGSKSVANIADRMSEANLILCNVASQIAGITGGVSITSSIPTECKAWVETSLKASPDGKTLFTRTNDGKVTQYVKPEPVAA